MIKQLIEPEDISNFNLKESIINKKFTVNVENKTIKFETIEKRFDLRDDIIISDWENKTENIKTIENKIIISYAQNNHLIHI